MFKLASSALFVHSSSQSESASGYWWLHRPDGTSYESKWYVDGNNSYNTPVASYQNSYSGHSNNPYQHPSPSQKRPSVKGPSLGGPSGYMGSGKNEVFWHIAESPSGQYLGSYMTPVTQYNSVYSPIQHEFNPAYSGFAKWNSSYESFYYINPTYNASYSSPVTKPINGPSGYMGEYFWHIDETKEGTYKGSFATKVSTYDSYLTPLQRRFDPENTGYMQWNSSYETFYYINPTYNQSYSARVPQTATPKSSGQSLQVLLLTDDGATKARNGWGTYNPRRATAASRASGIDHQASAGNFSDLSVALFSVTALSIAYAGYRYKQTKKIQDSESIDYIQRLELDSEL